MKRLKLIEAALALAAEQGWSRVRLADIAGRAELTLSDFHAEFSSKEALLEAFTHMIDARVLDEVAKAPQDALSTREQLFDVLMTRFEALKPYRLGLASIASEQACDLGLAFGSWGRVSRSMTWMLEAAGESTRGWMGQVKVKGLTGVYLSTLRAFLKDESEDLSVTMRALDKAMGRAESLAKQMQPRKSQKVTPTHTQERSPETDTGAQEA